MIRLHVLHDQIIRLPALQRGGEIVEPLLAKVLVYGVHDGDLLVQDHIGIVGHAARHDVLPFKQVHFMIVNANIADIICNIHGKNLVSFVFLDYYTG